MHYSVFVTEMVRVCSGGLLCNGIDPIKNLTHCTLFILGFRIPAHVISVSVTKYCIQ